MDIKSLFLQVKNFILCNYKILNILNGNNTQDNWKEDIFYAISNDDITIWKNYVGYKEICKELKKQENKKLIDDEDERWCCSIIKRNILKKKAIQNNFRNSTIYTSLFSPLKLKEEKEYISPNTYFYLISKELWELFGLNKNKKFSGKIPIIEGKNKILMKFKENKIILLSLAKNDETNIEITNLQKYLIEYIIDLDEIRDENEINKLVEQIKNMDILDFKKKIENDFLLIDDKKLSIQTKDALDISLNLNINSIIKDNQALDEEFVKKMLNSFAEVPSISDVKYICKVIVRKVRFCTYIISSMYSLSQIPEFTEYFFFRENHLLFESKLLFSFAQYLHNLWKEAGETTFDPSYFIHYLCKEDSKIFDIKSEKLPIVFLDKMFDYINKELGNKDIKITKQIKEQKPEFLENYNSIVSKVFYGIFNQKNFCTSCGKAKNNSLENDMFKYINIDISNYSDEQSKLDNSLAYFYLDDLIEFYFTKQKNLSYCENCKEIKEFQATEKEIYRLPDVLIINIDWGFFKEEEGFGLEENKLIFDKIIDLTKYSQTKQNEIKYEIRSVINYPIINDDPDKKWRKYITFNKHLVDQRYYCYQPGGKVIEFNSINRRRFVPSVFFYEKMK